MRYKVIANPAAGKGKARALIPAIRQRLTNLGLDFDLVCTERPWHAAELARQAAEEGYERIVAAGGDGTINEVLNGLIQNRKPGQAPACLGVICIGRGNDFAYGVGLPTHWEEGCRAVAQGSCRTVDVGRVSGDSLQQAHYFGNGLGIGFDATVNIQATKTRLTGFLGYLVAVLRTLLLNFKSPLVRIECDDATITQPSIMVSVMNGRRMGGGFIMAPHGDNRDGYLDVCIAHQVSRATILSMIPRFMQGTQAGHPAIRFARTRQITVSALNGDRLPVQIDGETITDSARQLKIEVIAGAIQVLGLPDKAPA